MLWGPPSPQAPDPVPVQPASGGLSAQGAPASLACPSPLPSPKARTINPPRFPPAGAASSLPPDGPREGSALKLIIIRATAAGLPWKPALLALSVGLRLRGGEEAVGARPGSGRPLRGGRSAACGAAVSADAGAPGPGAVAGGPQTRERRGFGLMRVCGIPAKSVQRSGLGFCLKRQWGQRVWLSG